MSDAKATKYTSELDVAKDLASGKIDEATAAAEWDALRQRAVERAVTQSQTASVRVTAKRTDRQFQAYGKPKGETEPGKGTVQVTGVRTRAISFYPREWEKLFALKSEIEKCIEQNRDALSWKRDK